MQAEWEPEELIEAWTLRPGDWGLVGNNASATRLGFIVMLKFYELEGRFPAYAEEVPPVAVEYLASLVKVDPARFAKYAWTGRTIEYHRAQIRRSFGTRPATEADEERWAGWLADEVCPVETSEARLAAAVLRRCRGEGVEPPTGGQVERVVASAGRRPGHRLGPATSRTPPENLSTRPDHRHHPAAHWNPAPTRAPRAHRHAHDRSRTRS